jgi:hypothetical protein
VSTRVPDALLSRATSPVLFQSRAILPSGNLSSKRRLVSPTCLAHFGVAHDPLLCLIRAAPNALGGGGFKTACPGVGVCFSRGSSFATSHVLCAEGPGLRGLNDGAAPLVLEGRPEAKGYAPAVSRNPLMHDRTTEGGRAGLVTALAVLLALIVGLVLLAQTASGGGEQPPCEVEISPPPAGGQPCVVLVHGP